MRISFCLLSTVLAAGSCLPALIPSALALQPGSAIIAAASLPDAPQPQAAPAAQQSDAEKSRHDQAEEQIKQQEKQRVLGVVPSFSVSYLPNAVPLSPGQKMRLAFRSAIDPVSFAGAFLAAGYHEAKHDDIGFPWGAKGFAERSGAAYLDSFDGAMIAGGILPSLLHQDPRYFRLGHGTATHRMLYALASTVICKHDNTGKWEANYSNVLGSFAAGGISNLYYPSSVTGASQTFTTGLFVIAGGGVGSVFQEFWPDVSRRLLHRDPTHGLDAQARAQDAADKAAKKQSASPQPVSPQ